MTTTTDKTQGGTLGHLSNAELIARVQAKLDDTLEGDAKRGFDFMVGQANAFRQVLALLKALTPVSAQEAK
jgi:hypothetical protein